jgi:hypothetical protein
VGRCAGLGRVWPAGPGAVHADTVYSVSSDTLVLLASGLDGRCVKKQCGLALGANSRS